MTKNIENNCTPIRRFCRLDACSFLFHGYVEDAGVDACSMAFAYHKYFAFTELCVLLWHVSDQEEQTMIETALLDSNVFNYLSC